MRKFFYSVLLLSLCIVGVAQAQPVPQGAEFQLNTNTNDSQWFPDAAFWPDGSYIMVWEDNAAPGDEGSGVRARRFDADGVEVGVEFKVNAYTQGTQKFPVVMVQPGGRYVVVWESDSTGENTSIRGRRYLSSGEAVSASDFVVSDLALSSQLPDASMIDDGSFVVVWRGTEPAGSNLDADGAGIHLRRFDPLNDPLGEELIVNAFTTGDQSRPVVAHTSDDGFLVVWESRGGQDGDAVGIVGKRYDSSGAEIGAEFVVNSYTTGDQQRPDLAILSDDSFVVTWASSDSGGDDTNGSSIQARLFDASANPIGQDFQVNSYTTSDQNYTSIGANTDDSFTIAWQSQGSAGSDTELGSVQMRSYYKDGTPRRDQVQLNEYTSSFQGVPTISNAVPDWDFFIVWQSLGSDGDDANAFSAQGRRLSYWLLRSDFEEGGFGEWSDVRNN